MKISTQKPQFWTGFVLAAGGAILFSAKAIVAKLTYRYGIDAVTLLMFRMLFSFPFFLAIAITERLKAQRAGPEKQLTTQHMMQIGLLGLLGYYLSSFLDFLGLQYISAGLERLILFLTPTLVLLSTAFWFKRRIQWREWLALLICYAGIVVVFSHDLQITGDRVYLGASLVFGAAASYAGYLLLSGELVERVGATRLVAYAMCVSSVVCIAQFFVLHPPSMLMQPLAVYGLSFLNATLCTVMPVFMTMWAVVRIGAPTTSQMSMVGPVSTLFLGLWFLGEPITVWQLSGTALVITGIGVLSSKKSS